MVGRGTWMEPGLRRAALEQALRRARTALFGWTDGLGVRVPARLHIAPQDLRTSDPTIATEIYAGQLKFAGKLLETHGESPFALTMPSTGFAHELHGFGWLRHLRAVETALANAHARALVQDWISAASARRSQIPADPDVTARRLISWLSQSPLLLQGGDAVFYRQFTKALAQDVRRLKTGLSNLPNNERRLLPQIALTHFALCCADRDQELKAAATALCDLLDEQIQPDGSHPSRDPSLTLALLLDLLPLKVAFPWRRIQTPQPIVSAIDRMLPFLRMMRHADGAIALFNGAGATRADLMASVLAQDDVIASPPSTAPYGGYQRIEANGSVLIADVGAPPLPPLAGRAHGAPCAFEFSADAHRIFINCGAPPEHRHDLAAFSRVTAAHCTLVLNDTGIGRIAREGRSGFPLSDQYVAGATTVDGRRTTTVEGTLLAIQHDGYRRRLGAVHRRNIALSADGSLLEGEDVVERAGGAGLPAVLRFHLHPLAKATLTADRRQAYIRLPGRSVWVFSAADLPLQIEESAFFASPDGMRRTDQITVAFDVTERDRIPWQLARG